MLTAIKMVQEQYTGTLEIPQGVTLTVDKGIVTVKGEKGEIKKNLFSPIVSITVSDNIVTFMAKKTTKGTKKLANTFKAHVKNTFKGVTEGHTYKLKICSGHFPMTVALKGDTLEIKNFIGEKVPRTLKIREGASVKVDGTSIVVESNEKEIAGQVAASIELLTRRPGFDKRIFQDGIYLVEKDGKQIK